MTSKAGDPAHRLGPGKKALFSLTVLAVLLFASELGVRCLPATRLGFVYRDGGFWTPTEFTPDNALNANRFHDVVHGPKLPNVRRVMLLGDSYVAGRSVPVQATVGQRLQHHLNAASVQSYEVISIGRIGWGQREQLRSFKKHHQRIHPDWVVTLVLTFNDVRNNSDALTAINLAQRREMERWRPEWVNVKAGDAPLFLVPGSRLNQLLSYRLAQWSGIRKAEGIPIDYYVYAAVQDDRWQQAWRTTERLLVRTHELATRIGAHYGVVCASTPHGVYEPDEALRRLERAYPDMRDQQWDVDAADRRVDQISQARGIPTLLLQPVFRHETVENGRRLHWEYDGHWNLEGNDLAAREIARFILELDRSQERLENE